MSAGLPYWGYHERRRTPRIDVLGQVHVHILSCPAPASLREISLGGFSIESTMAFPPGLVHQFRFALEDGSETHVSATSVHCAISSSVRGTPVHVTGFEFIQRERHVRDTVEELIERISNLIAVG